MWMRLTSGCVEYVLVIAVSMVSESVQGCERRRVSISSRYWKMACSPWSQ